MCYLKQKAFGSGSSESLCGIGGSDKTRTCDLYDVNVAL